MYIDKERYRQLSISKPYNSTPWVKIAPAPSGKAWRAICVHHLTGVENSRNHNVYVDLLDGDNKFIVNPQERLAFTWDGQRPEEKSPPIKLDKPANEPAGNVSVWKGANTEVWIDSSYPSDHVSNLTTDLPDEDEGNTRFHHSYYIIFKLVDSAQVTEPTTPDVNLLTGVNEIIRTLVGLRDTIDHYLDELRALQG